MMSTARAQGLGIVFNTSFEPPEGCPEYFVLWDMFAWMYDVLRQKVKIGSGRVIIRNHLMDYNVRVIMQELEVDACSSTQGRLLLRQGLQTIITMRLNSEWKKPFVDYIRLFENRVINYNEQQPVAATRINNIMCRQYLEASVSTCKPLREVSQREMERMAEGTSQGYTYDQYVIALKSAAALADEGRSIKASRGVNIVEINKAYFDTEDDTSPMTAEVNHTELNQDHDTDPVSTDEEDDSSALMAYKSNIKRQPGSTMNKETWNSLSSDTQTKWDSIQGGDKTKILRYSAQRADNRAKTQANVTDISDPSEESKDDEGVIEVNSGSVVSKAKDDAHPGDPRKVMSTTTSNKKVSANTARFLFDGEDSNKVDRLLDAYWDNEESSESQDF